MKRKLKVTLALCLSLLMVLTMAAPVFAKPLDIQGHWAEVTISKWVDKGWINGYSDGSFGPEDMLMKAQIAALANRSFGFVESTGVDTVLDVLETDWFAGDISKAIAAGYLAVPGDGNIKPKSNVTREEIAEIICKILKPVQESTDDAIGKLTDAKDITEDKKTAVNTVLSMGIMKGYPGNIFDPKGFVTRAQGVVILDRMLAAVENGLATVIAGLPAIPGGAPATSTPGGSNPGNNNPGGSGVTNTPTPTPGTSPSPSPSPSPSADPTQTPGTSPSMTPTTTPAVTPALPEIDGITVENGTVWVSFNKDVASLLGDDFKVTATLDGQDYTDKIQNLVFVQKDSKYTFTAIPRSFKSQRLEMTVAALPNSPKVSGSASNVFIIDDDPNANPELITGLEFSNGKLKVKFNGNVTGLTADDLSVNMEKDGSSYTPGDLEFNPEDNSFSFTFITQTNKDQNLSVTVKKAEGSLRGITGIGTASFILKGFYSNIELLGFEVFDDGEGAVTNSKVKFKLLPDIGELEYVSVRLLDGPGNVIAKSDSYNVTAGTSIYCPFEVDAPAVTSFASLMSVPVPDWSVITSWSSNEDGSVTIPNGIEIEVKTIDGLRYMFNSQETVKVNLNWAVKDPYEWVDNNMLFGLNAFADIQSGVDAVNPGGRVIVAEGVYPVSYNDYTGNYGIVIYKPLSLLGAQAFVQPVENGIRTGGESIIAGGTTSEEYSGGGGITVAKNAGHVEINGFTFKYNDMGIDVSVFVGEEEPTGTNNDGLVVKYNRFINNAIDVLVNNSDSYMQNYSFYNNVFGLHESDWIPYIDLEAVRNVVNTAHRDLEQASNGNFITIELSLGVFVQNPQGLKFENNTVYGKTIGVGILGGEDFDSRLYGNYFHGNRFGIGLLGSSGNYAVDINRNVLTNNTLGLASLLGGKINATGNYWGSVDWIDIRPAVLGEADIVSNISTVEYFPWALDRECTKLANSDLAHVIVDSRWEGFTDGKQVMHEGKDYYIGVNAYPFIQTAVSHSASDYLMGFLRNSEGYDEIPEINVVPGIYNETVGILFPVKLMGLSGTAENEIQLLNEHPKAIINGDVIIQSYEPTNECFTVRNLEIKGDLIVDYASNVVIKDNFLPEGSAIIFNYIPDLINWTGLEDITEKMISDANNGAEVRFAEANIYWFEVDGQEGTSTIDGTTGTIVFKMPVDADISALKPTIIISPRATISPEGPQDFNYPVEYTVTSGDGTARVWTVICKHEPIITSFAAIEQVSVTEAVYYTGVIDMMGRTVTFNVPFGTDLNALTTEITVSDNGIINPKSGETPVFTAVYGQPKTFTAPYTVTSEDGLIVKNWTVKCLEDPNTENDILDLSIANAPSLYIEKPIIIDTDGKMVTFRVPNITEAQLASLVMDIEVSPEAVYEWEPLEIAEDGAIFTYCTVTAGNGDEEDWLLQCIPYSGKHDITGFSAVIFDAGSSTVTDVVYSLIIDNSNQSVVFEVVYGTDVTALQPTIGISDYAFITPSVLVQDFTNPVYYQVIAQDGVSYAIWEIRCVILPESTEEP